MENPAFSPAFFRSFLLAYFLKTVGFSGLSPAFIFAFLLPFSCFFQAF
ncbi:hypothetical protein B4146_0165 [Bacillus subtilis]|uniref:Uncharacterized protein n=1 Tax=Bacillus subtilis TaxID=1423 RepID=A0AAP1HAU2_BACIU|nr:hypothetical protein B4146_0594 [Bacillus subtilis]KIN54416.1 hypothetical protein B4146_0165 [Bacillus subtilis]KZD89047.1 hypothetical protein B4122_3935 [Bacillus subtilis]KZD94465.1 hypothetical protein B4122_1161 [Bacillus subtilis]